jgi:Tfp pilus assembly protein PilF
MRLSEFHQEGRKLEMKQFLVVGAILISCAVSAATATERSTLKTADEAKFNHAVELLDGYRGDTSALELARAELDEVLKTNPRHAPAHREKARYFIMRGHMSSLRFQPGSLEAADSSINKAIEISPNYAEAFVLRGHLYRLMNRHHDAIDALEKAEKLGTTDPWLQNNWADLLIDEGKYEVAAQRYRTVIDSKTQNKKAMGAAYEGLIRYYTGVGKLDQADEIYRRKIDFEPNAAWSYGNYAQFLLCLRDDYENAIGRSRQALNIMNYGAGRYWLASALYRKWAQSAITGASDYGRQYFLEAQAIYPDPNEIAANAATCPPLRFIAQALARSKVAANPALQGTPASGRP